MLDQSDRSLRKIEIGLGSHEAIQLRGTTPGVDPKVQQSRITGFDVTAASEVCASVMVMSLLVFSHFPCILICFNKMYRLDHVDISISRING